MSTRHLSVDQLHVVQWDGDQTEALGFSGSSASSRGAEESVPSGHAAGWGSPVTCVRSASRRI